jgi:hypothetical protein
VTAAGLLALCAEFTRAEAECLGRWCTVTGGRGRVERDRLVTSQAPLHEAAGHLHSWCLAHVEEAEGERRQLLVR